MRWTARICSGGKRRNREPGGACDKEDMRVRIMDGTRYIEQVRSLLLEYTRQLGRDLTFQHIDEELRDPAKKYAAPYGALLVVVEEDDVVGMVAYRRHSAVRCEMKRLYVRPGYRSRGIGERLVGALLEHASNAGYEEMVLDTLAPMHSARHLYAKFGFETCASYYDNPMPDVLYLKKDLRTVPVRSDSNTSA